MSTNYPEYRKHLNDLTKQLAQQIPQTMSAFGQMHKAGMASGALSSKVKELIALGIAISARCGGCIGFHVNAALKAGATKEEVLEAIGVAVVMGGGPSTVYGCEALDALNQFQSAV